MYLSRFRYLVLFCISLFMSVPFVCAQEPVQTQELVPVGVSEFELYLGVGSPIGTKEGYTNEFGVYFCFDARFNLRNAPVALGAQIGFIGASRTDNDDLCSCMNDGPFMFLGGTVEYDFNRGEKSSFFIGTGVGIHTSSAGYLRPKIGGEFFNRLRVSAYSNIVLSTSGDGFTSWGISVGYVFGGRPKKNK